MRRILTALLLLVPLVIASGCIDYETGVAFNKDLTGRASFKMTMDLAPFLNNMASAMAARGGGPPPDEMISMVKSQLATQFASGLFNVEELKKSLPAGVTLADSAQKLDDLKVVMNFAFAFTDATKLPLIELPPPQLSGATGMGANVASKELKPFDSLVITADAKTISITSKPKETPAPGSDTAATAAAAQSAITQAKAQLESLGMGDVMKGLSIHMTMRFEVPQEVVEQNATRKEGQAYIWEVKIDDLSTMLDKVPDPPVIMLKFKK